MNTKEKISCICDELENFLHIKNTRYGDSVLSPIQIFSKLDITNSLYVRIDDKINRIKNSDELRKNDIVDLIGYLVLLCIDKDWLQFSDLID